MNLQLVECDQIQPCFEVGKESLKNQVKSKDVAHELLFELVKPLAQ